MGQVTLNDIQSTPQKRIGVPGGDVLHALRRDDPAFAGFGEAYFSWVDGGAFKGWKLHERATLNLVVPIGMVRFVFFDEHNRDTPRVEAIGDDDYRRLTVPPGIVFGFQGLADPRSLILSISSEPHHPDEVRRYQPDDFPFAWR